MRGRGCCFRGGMRRRWRRGWRSCWTMPRTAGSWGRRRDGGCRSISRGSKRHGRWGRFTWNFWRVQGDAPLSPLHPQGAASGSLELNEGIAVGAPTIWARFPYYRTDPASRISSGPGKSRRSLAGRAGHLGVHGVHGAHAGGAGLLARLARLTRLAQLAGGGTAEASGVGIGDLLLFSRVEDELPLLI